MEWTVNNDVNYDNFHTAFLKQWVCGKHKQLVFGWLINAQQGQRDLQTYLQEIQNLLCKANITSATQKKMYLAKALTLTTCSDTLGISLWMQCWADYSPGPERVVNGQQHLITIWCGLTVDTLQRQKTFWEAKQELQTPVNENLLPPMEMVAKLEVTPDSTNPRIKPAPNTPLMEEHYAELLKQMDEMDLATDTILMLEQQQAVRDFLKKNQLLSLLLLSWVSAGFLWCSVWVGALVTLFLWYADNLPTVYTWTTGNTAQ